MRTKPIPETAAFGIDIGKKVFHVVALTAAGTVIQRAKFSRDTLMAFFETAPKVLIGMEACPGSQWLARRLAAMGHDARIIPARFVKPYVKSNKTDTVDAAAIAEAVTRPTMYYLAGDARIAGRALRGSSNARTGRSAGASPHPRPACWAKNRADEPSARILH